MEKSDDLTLGWALSAAIGPGRLQDSPFTGLAAVIVRGLTALCLYTLAACIGALGARRSVRARSTQRRLPPMAVLR